MKFVAKVFKSGNSLAVRLPAALNVKVKELCIEQGRDGDIILYDEKERRQAWKKRQQAFEEFVKNTQEKDYYPPDEVEEAVSHSQ